MSRLFASKQFAEEIDMVFSAFNRKGCGSIYISNIQAARNMETLNKLGIKAVISVVKGGFLPHPQCSLPNYLYLPAEDNESFNIAAYFEKTYSFIDKNLKRSNVLVHCAAGVSRSASIVIAFIMKHTGAGYSEAMSRVRVKRPSVCPNAGFIAQLKMYQRDLKSAKLGATENKERKNDKVQNQKHQNKEILGENQQQNENSMSRGRSLLNFSTKRLDTNIQLFKEKCQRFEAISKHSKPKRRSVSMNKKSSSPHFKQVCQMTSQIFDKVIPGELAQHRSKTQNPQELSNYITNLN